MTTHSDAQLVKLGANLRASWEAQLVHPLLDEYAAKSDEELAETHLNASQRIVSQITALPATSLEGIRAGISAIRSRLPTTNRIDDFEAGNAKFTCGFL